MATRVGLLHCKTEKDIVIMSGITVENYRMQHKVVSCSKDSTLHSHQSYVAFYCYNK